MSGIKRVTVTVDIADDEGRSGGAPAGAAAPAPLGTAAGLLPEPGRQRELTQLYLALVQDLARWKQSHQGREGDAIDPPVVWRLHQVARRYYKDQTLGVDQARVEMNALLAQLPERPALRNEEIERLAALMLESVNAPLAPYDPSGGGPVHVMGW